MLKVKWYGLDYETLKNEIIYGMLENGMYFCGSCDCEKIYITKRNIIADYKMICEKLGQEFDTTEWCKQNVITEYEECSKECDEIMSQVTDIDRYKVGIYTSDDYDLPF